MQYYKIDPENPDKNTIKKAVKCLEEGGLIVYPTDTLYGLGVDVFNRKAVNKLFLVKQRDMRNPVSLMLHSIQQIKEIFGIDSPALRTDLEKLLPGKYTAVINNPLQKKIPIIENVNEPGTYLEKVGVRIPDHAVCKELTTLIDSPISTTSANLSGAKNVFNIQDIIAYMGDKLDLILDAGPIKQSKGSTVIDFTHTPYKILRAGDISSDDVAEKIGSKKILQLRDKFIITFVCSGNICRSPMAEYILRQMLTKTKYRKHVKVQSAGTLRIETSPAHEYAINVSNAHDLDLNPHSSQPVDDKIMEKSDLVFALAQNHFVELNRRYPQHKNKIGLLKQWKRPYQISIPSIADPIGHSLTFFQGTYDEIYSEVKRVFPGILSHLRNFCELHGLV